MNNDLPDEAINRRVGALMGDPTGPCDGELSYECSDSGPYHLCDKCGEYLAWGTEDDGHDAKPVDYPNDYEAAVRAWEKLSGPDSVLRFCTERGKWMSGIAPSSMRFIGTFPRVICLAIIHQHGAE